MQIDRRVLALGKAYDRPELARLWKLEGWQALARGIVTPRDSNTIILFVTAKKQQCMEQYKDSLNNDTLDMEGESNHLHDERLAKSREAGDTVLLFFREYHHAPFVYYGQVDLIDWRQRQGAPSCFSFKLLDASGRRHQATE